MSQEQGQYCWPMGFAFDNNYHDRIYFNKTSKNFNADKKMAHLRKFVQMLIDQETSDHVFMTFGCDMAFTKAIVDFEHLDLIIDQFNQQNEGIEIMYSTP